MASIDRIHYETKVLPLRTHCDLLTKQYMLRCDMPHHLGNRYLNRLLLLQLMKNDLGPQLQLQFQSGELAKLCWEVFDNKGMQKLSQGLTYHLCGADGCRLWAQQSLNTTASEIDASEIKLPRKARTCLAQLRFGYCARLNPYKHRLNSAVPGTCPDYSTSHSVAHLFDCPMHQTDLTPMDLWLRPQEVTEFLKAWPEQDGGQDTTTTTTTSEIILYRDVLIFMIM